MASSFCTACGAPLNEGVRFCSACGTALQPDAPPPAPSPPKAPVCPACGSPLREESKFCMECGVTLTPANPPQQPNAVTQVPGPGQPYHAPIPTAQQKKRRSPLIWIIPAGAVVLAGIIVAVVLLTGNSVLSAAKTADYYEIGEDRVPTVLLALGEEREMTGASVSTSGGVRTQQYTYAVNVWQGEDMLRYATYLRENDGFAFTTDADFNRSIGEAIQLMREAEEDGYVLVVQLDYDGLGYTVSVMRGEGTVQAIEEAPEPDPPTPDAIEATPAPTIEPAETDSTPTDGPMPGEDTIRYFVLDRNLIPTIYYATGNNRDHVYILQEQLGTANAQYDMTEMETILRDVTTYDAFLTEREGWIRVTDTDYGQSEGTVQFGKPAMDEGEIVVVQVDWNAQGYKITMSIFEGTLTVNE